jgi:hypothetical protein
MKSLLLASVLLFACLVGVAYAQQRVDAGALELDGASIALSSKSFPVRRINEEVLAGRFVVSLTRFSPLKKKDCAHNRRIRCRFEAHLESCGHR